MERLGLELFLYKMKKKFCPFIRPRVRTINQDNNLWRWGGQKRERSTYLPFSNNFIARCALK